MKYFFLAEGWTYKRVWEFGGLWNYEQWRREPHIQQLKIGIVEKDQTLWLYEIEDSVLMVEVVPKKQGEGVPNIGQVLLKRLITPAEVLAQLNQAEAIIKYN